MLTRDNGLFSLPVHGLHCGIAGIPRSHFHRPPAVLPVCFVLAEPVPKETTRWVFVPACLPPNARSFTARKPTSAAPPAVRSLEDYVARIAL